VKKIAVLFTCFFILTTGVVLPTITSESMLPLSKKSHSYNDSFNSITGNRSDEIKNLYEMLIYKINADLDPTTEIKSLLTFEEIQTIFSLIDGNESIERIRMIFSDKPSIVKNLFLTRELIKDRTRESETYYEINDIFDTSIIYEIESVDDIHDLEIVQTLNLSKSQLLQLYDHWHNFLWENPSIAKLFDFEEPDVVVFILIFLGCLIAYVFIINGLLATIITADHLFILTLAIGTIEAILFGLAMTFSMAEFYPLNNRSITNLIAEFVIFLVPSLGEYWGGVEAMVSYSFGLLFLVFFLALYVYSPLISFICAGLFFIGINVLISIIVFFLYNLIIENIRPTSYLKYMNRYSI
jgi:hypothetical protein